MKNVVILTGDELRHQYFRRAIALSPGIRVLASYCEGAEESLGARVMAGPDSTDLMKAHVQMRSRSEEDFFRNLVSLTEDRTNKIAIMAGMINDPGVVKQIISSKPDLLVCYGSSLIKSELLSKFQRRFLNVHLGLAPYYRGSGTNVWPMINREPEFIGATFMYIDPGIDTGDIIHQIRARIFLGDGLHQIGNRLISDMCLVYAQIIRLFDGLARMDQPAKLSGKFYKQKDFDKLACAKLYDNFTNGLLDEYLRERDIRRLRAPIIENPVIGAGK